MTQLVFDYEYWAYAPDLIPNSDATFESLLPKLEDVCRASPVTMYGKTFESRRISCLFAPSVEEVRQKADAKSNGFDYNDTPAYDWDSSPDEIAFIRKYIEKFFGFKSDYVLCHVYRGATSRTNAKGETVEEIGQDYIGWHNDKEALGSEIMSVTLGASRRFQFRKLEDKKGVSDEFRLQCGDVVHMKGPREGKKSCQRVYKHCVPQMNVGDLLNHIQEIDGRPFEGRKTKASVSDYIKANDMAPTRINLTFRQY